MNELVLAGGAYTPQRRKLPLSFKSRLEQPLEPELKSRRPEGE